MANKSLTQVWDIFAVNAHMGAQEGEDITAEDLYTIAGEVEECLAALLSAAQKKEKELA